MQISLNGRRALVTAGASGIGRAIAENLHSSGADVIICDNNQALLDDMHKCHPTIGAYHCDVGNADNVEKFFATIKEYGDIDILINNAGIAGPTGPLHELSADDWQNCLNVCLNSQFYFAKEVIPAMKKNKGGNIINISSTAGILGFPNRSPYAAAKWAICGLTKTLAMELGADNIRVNAICPGSVNGDRIERVMAAHAEVENITRDEVYRQYCLGTSMQTFVDKQDIANMICFLCSDKGRFISGQIISIDGHSETLHPRL